LIAQNQDDYVAKAQDFAARIVEVRALRQGIRDKMKNSRMTDGKDFALELQQALRTMWVANAPWRNIELGVYFCKLYKYTLMSKY